MAAVHRTPATSADHTIAARVAEFALTRPASVALRAGELQLSYGELHAEALAVASELRQLGVSAGSTVGILCGSTMECVVALLGTWYADATAAGLNPRHSDAQIRSIAERTGCRVVLTDGSSAVDRLASRSIPDSTVRVAGEFGLSGPPLARPDDVAVVYFTSGTTGIPRAVAHGHAGLVAQVHASRDLYGITEDDVLLVSSPLSSLSVLLCGPLLALAFGASCSIVAPYSVDEILRVTERDRVTICTIAPAFFHDMCVRFAAGASAAPLSTVRAIHYGAVRTDPAVVQEFERRSGVRASQGYGSTECPNTVAAEGLGDERRWRSVGRALPFAEIVIEGPNGSAVPVGEVGEITVGPNPLHPYAMQPMLGYVGAPEKSDAVLANGRLHMGDLGRLDEDGYLYVLDRKKDLINRGGVKVYPYEIERLLLARADVVDAVVTGEPDERLGEVVVAYVTLRESEDLVSCETLLRETNAQLASEKRLFGVWAAAELPRDELGKVSRERLELLRATRDSAPG